jgi:threonine dehydratase
VITLDDVRAAAGRIDGVARRTPVVRSAALDEVTGANVACKAEMFQRVGAFKFRGAYSMLSALDGEALSRGVVAYSSGNHAQAVALAARLHGARAVIVMPRDAPRLKLAATRGYGAEVVLYDRGVDDRAAIAQRLADEQGLTVVPPYDHELIMAGQGTVALELLEDEPELDILLVPVGGGGLLAGCATAASALRSGITIVGVEPEASDDTRRSLAAGHRVEVPPPQTIADGQQLTTPGELTFDVVKRLVDDVVTVSDDEIVEAMRFCFERLKIVAEPSGASALAALLAGRAEVAGSRVGVVLSGGNVDAGRFGQVLAAVR